MLIIRHRINTIKELGETPIEHGVEIDIRDKDGRLYLNHDPFSSGDDLDEYLSHFRHAFIILEVKTEGIEKKVLELVKKHNIKNYFLLSVTPPFMWMLAKEGIKEMAVRFSEYEDIGTTLKMAGKVNWVWVDVPTKNPLDVESYKLLKNAGFKICLVCPERWKRPQDIPIYKDYFKKNNIKLDAVMTNKNYEKDWKDLV